VHVLSAGDRCGRSGALLGTLCSSFQERRAAEGFDAHHRALHRLCHDRKLERCGASGVHLLPNLLLSTQPLLPRSLRRQCAEVKKSVSELKT
jgi:hypothetical protein